MKKYFFVVLVSFVLLSTNVIAEKPSNTAYYSSDYKITCKKDVPAELDAAISHTIQKVQANLVDVNGDGLKNCIDHAILFYLVWTKYVDKSPDSCIIIRNYNSFNKFHHLFVEVKDNKSGNYIEVEPWASNSYRYFMSDNWSSRYDSRFNIYNETEKWANKADMRKIRMSLYK